MTSLQRRLHLAKGSCLRLKRWEYWPSWVLYAPVVVYLLWLGWRRKHLTLFTATNPTIPASGIIDESKAAILRQLRQSESAKVIPWLALPHDFSDKQTRVEAWMEKEGLDYPIVAKPDVGQRGSGVHLLHSRVELMHLLSRDFDRNILLQAYDNRCEYSVFLARNPEGLGFEITSLTKKSLPEVIGDGHSNLESLILKHPRHVASARQLLAMNENRRLEVPTAGSRLRLSVVGAHCRGACFFDGRHLASPALLKSLADMLDDSGLNFGRFDLMADNDEQLKMGRNLGIIEFNGVSSESTHIYDPKTPLSQAWRDLLAQWRWAVELGHHYQRQGVATTGLLDIARTLRSYRSKSSF